MIFLILACGQNRNSSNNAAGPQDTRVPFVPQICSELDFSGATWPVDLTETQKSLFALSLNVTGSFEGNVGWQNISNNFDGQGLSLGLLNQNLGSGTLQPLLIQASQRFPALMQKIFSPDHYQSLVQMLGQFQKEAPLRLMHNQQKIIWSMLDLGIKMDLVSPASSVQWAKQNLYQNGQFIPQWKKEFQTLANTWDYINLQIEAAKEYYLDAVTYFAQLKVSQVRAYLMLFDIVVQNGALYTTDVNDYLTYLSQSPNASEGNRLKKILELRLRHVKPQYVAIVRARKQTIIDGTGVVNGTNRQLEKEYCYDHLSAFPQ